MRSRGQSIAGSNSGKGGGSVAPDSLRSTSFAFVIDALSEGEIEGLVDSFGNLLADAIITQPTQSDGSVNNNSSVVYGGYGYTLDTLGTATGSFNLAVAEGSPNGDGSGGTGGVAQVNVVNGVVISIDIINSGNSYTSPVIVMPAAIGKAVFLNGVAMQNANMSSFYATNNTPYTDSSITLAFTPGTQTQSPLAGFSHTETTYSIQAPLLGPPQNVQQQWTITGNDAVASIIVAVRFAALESEDTSTGDITGSAVAWQVFVTYTYNAVVDGTVNNTPIVYGGGEQLLYGGFVNGKSSGAYERTDEIVLPKITVNAVNHTWNLRFVRLTDEPDNASNIITSNDMIVDYLVTVVPTPFSYPNTALVGLSVDAAQFSSVPTRGYQVKGLRIQVPTNYFPIDTLGTVVVNGVPTPNTKRPCGYYNRNPDGTEHIDVNGNPVKNIWDGSFYTAWTNNPAWVIYDLIMNPRYGTGLYVNEILGPMDKWSLYTIAQYCDGLVNDGFGGLEPRYTCNTYIQAQKDAYQVLSDFATVFRGVLYWAAGMIIPVQDAPASPVKIFTSANVEAGRFSYSGTARKARSTAIMVAWVDPSSYFQTKYEYVPDFAGIVRYGFRQRQVTAFACTSRGQARRTGLDILYSEIHQTQTVSFVAGLEASYLRPGDVIGVMDNHRAGVTNGGRILAFSPDNTQIYMDRPWNTNPYDPQGQSPLAGSDGVMGNGNLTLTTGYLNNIKAGQYVGATIAVESSIGVITDNTATISGQTSFTVASWSGATPTGAGNTWEVETSASYPGTPSTGWSVIVADPSPSANLGNITDSTQIPEIRAAQVVTIAVNSFAFDPKGNTILILAAPVPPTVPVGSVFALLSDTVEIQQFRVITVNEGEKNKFEVLGMQYDSQKYGVIEDGLTFTDPVISLLPGSFEVPGPPVDVTAQSQTLTASNVKSYQALVSWGTPSGSFVKEYEVYYQRESGNPQYYTTTTSNSVDIPIQTADEYTFIVYAIGYTGKRSSPASATIYVGDYASLTGEVEEVTGLEVDLQGSGYSFNIAAPTFYWRINSTYSFEFGSEPNGADSGGHSKSFVCYIINISDPNTGNILYTTTTTLNQWTFDFATNAAIPGGPYREFYILVQVLDTTNNLSVGETLLVSNPAPAIPTGVTVSANPNTGPERQLVISFSAPAEPDFAAFAVWISAAGGSDNTSGAPQYVGPGPAVFPVIPGDTYQYNYAELDVFNLNTPTTANISS